MHKRLLILLFGFIGQLSFAQAPPIQYQNVYGGVSYDEAVSVKRMYTSNQYFMVGNSTSGAEMSGTPPKVPKGSNVFIMSLTAAQGLINQSAYLGTKLNDYVTAMDTTLDGNLVIVGYTDSTTYDPKKKPAKNNQYNYNGFISKVNTNLVPIWTRTFGGWGDDYLRAVCRTSDGGYLVAGSSNSDSVRIDGTFPITSRTDSTFFHWIKHKVSPFTDSAYVAFDSSTFYSPTRNRGDFDFWVMKLNSNGKMVWRSQFGGTGFDEATTVLESPDKQSYYVGGYSKSNNGDFPNGNNHGGFDYWLIQIDKNTRQIISSQNFGGSGDDILNAMQVDASGKVYMAGTSNSIDGPASDHHGAASLADGFVVAASAPPFAQLWTKSYGGTRLDGFKDIQNVPGNKFLLAGYSSSTDFDVVARNPTANGSDVWAVLIDPATNGAISWQKPVGSRFDEHANSAIYFNGGYVLAGYADLPQGQTYQRKEDVRPLIWPYDTSGLTSFNGYDFNSYWNGYNFNSLSLFPPPLRQEDGGKDIWAVKLGGPCVQPFNEIIVTSGSLRVDSVCPGVPVRLNTFDRNPVANVFTNYRWKINGKDTSIASDTLMTFKNATSVPYTVTISLTTYKGPTCSLNFSYPLKINANPALTNLTPNPGPIESSKGFALCSGSNSTLFVSAPTSNGYKYKWFQDGLPVSISPTYAVVNDTVSHKYRITLTNISGCSSTSNDTTLIVNPNPPANPIYSSTKPMPIVLCPSETTVLHAPTGDFTYQWAPIASTSSSITVSASGDYTATITQAYPNDHISCSTTLTPVHVATDTVVTVTITPDRPLNFCKGDSVVLTAGPATGFTFSWSDGKGEMLDTALSSALYTVVGTDVNGCTKNASVNVVANTNPAPVITPLADTAACFGNTVTLKVTQPYVSYTWLMDSITNPVGAVDTFLVSTTGNYTVSVTDLNGCVGVANYRNVIIRDQIDPNITLSGSNNLCSYDSLTLSATDELATTYLWNTGETSRVIKVKASSSLTSYTCTVTSYGCSTVSNAVPITVYPLTNNLVIQSTLPQPIRFCDGGVVTLSSLPLLQTYNWSNSYATATIDVKSTQTISLSGVDMNGCIVVPSAPVTVTVDTLPKVKIDGPAAYCNGTGAPLVVKTAYSSYTWSANAGNATTSGIFASSAGKYDVTVVDSHSCAGSASINLRKDTILPVLLVAVGEPTFCAGGSVTLIDTTARDGDTYSWSTGATAFTTNYAIINASGDYDVTVTNKYGCSGVSNSINVEAKPLPDIRIDPQGETEFCRGGKVVIKATPGFPVYNWSNGALVDSTVIKDSLTVFVLVKGGNGCENMSNSVKVTVHELPVAEITSLNGDPTEFCDGGSVTITAGNHASYLWSDLSTTANLDVKNTATYTVTVSNTFGCTAFSAPFQVIVHPKPPVPVITVQLQLLSSDAPVNNQWYKGLKPIPNATNNTYYVTVSDVYKVRVTNEFGCFSESLPVTVNIPSSGVENVSFTRSLKLYPNPVVNNLNVEYSLNERTEVGIELFDLLGQKVATILEKQVQIHGNYKYAADMSGQLPAGTYLVKITAGEAIYTARVILSK